MEPQQRNNNDTRTLSTTSEDHIRQNGTMDDSCISGKRDGLERESDIPTGSQTWTPWALAPCPWALAPCPGSCNRRNTSSGTHCRAVVWWPAHLENRRRAINAAGPYSTPPEKYCPAPSHRIHLVLIHQQKMQPPNSTALEGAEATTAVAPTRALSLQWGAADAQTAHPATSSTAPAHQRRGSANAETTPAGAPAAAADRTQRPDATCGGKNG